MFLLDTNKKVILGGDFNTSVDSIGRGAELDFTGKYCLKKLNIV